jgi:hypothetical protein
MGLFGYIDMIQRNRIVLIKNNLKGKLYKLRDGKDGRDFIFQDIKFINGKYFVECLIAPNIGKKPSVPYMIALDYFNKHSFQYCNNSYHLLKNHYDHDWDYNRDPLYPYLTYCKVCKIKVSDFSKEEGYLTCNEAIVKDIIE